MSLQTWAEWPRRLVSRERRQARADEFYAKIVREEEELVRNDPSQIVRGVELDAARKEIVG